MSNVTSSVRARAVVRGWPFISGGSGTRMRSLVGMGDMWRGGARTGVRSNVSWVMVTWHPLRIYMT